MPRICLADKLGGCTVEICPLRTVVSVVQQGHVAQAQAVLTAVRLSVVLREETLARQAVAQARLQMMPGIRKSLALQFIDPAGHSNEQLLALLLGTQDEVWQHVGTALHQPTCTTDT